MDKISNDGYLILKKIVERLEDGYLKLNVNGVYMPLIAELVNHSIWNGIEFKHISLAHYGECNGDLMADPEMIFLFNEEKEIAIPFYYKNDYAGIEQYSILTETNICYPKMQTSHTKFAESWLVNMKEQQDL